MLVFFGLMKKMNDLDHSFVAKINEQRIIATYACNLIKKIQQFGYAYEFFS